jgi:hypothetical protein
MDAAGPCDVEVLVLCPDCAGVVVFGCVVVFATVLPVTVIVFVAPCPPATAEIVAVPGLCAVTTPEVDTVATCGSLLAQVAAVWCGERA